jgi:hypothetical protein
MIAALTAALTTGTLAAAAPPVPSTRTLTAADSGKTVQLVVGQRVRKR